MKSKYLILSGVMLLLVAGCACNHGPSARTGRYQTVVTSNGYVVITDTVTGQAWAGSPKDNGELRPKQD